MSVTPKARAACRLRASAAALACLAVMTSAAVAAPGWISRILGHHEDPETAAARHKPTHYQTDDGGGFVLDHTGEQLLLRFDDSPEAWVLTAARGPRGDLIYFDDAGRTLLRTNQMGGVTVFTTTRPSGAAAARDSTSAPPLRLTSIGPAALYQRLIWASARAGRAAHHLVAFEAPNADPASDGLIADAATTASEAVATLAGRPEGRRALTRLARVEIDRGGESEVSQRGGVLKITVAPAHGFAGRPSSARILRALSARS